MAGNLPDPSGRNADKRYYRSGQESAVSRPHSERGLKSNIPIPGARADERSSDKYYREGGVKGGPSQQLPGERLQRLAARQARREIARATPVHRKAARPTAPGRYRLSTEEEVAGVCAAIVEHLQDPASSEVVVLVTGDSSLAMRLRTYLDLAVSREQITEAQYRDVTISVAGATDLRDRERSKRAPDTTPETRTPDEMFGAPEVQRATVNAPVQEEEVTNIGDFLAQPVEDEGDDFLTPPDVAEEVVMQDGTTGEIEGTLSRAPVTESEHRHLVPPVHIYEVGEPVHAGEGDFLAAPEESKPATDDVPEPASQPVQPLGGVPAQPRRNKKKRRR